MLKCLVTGAQGQLGRELCRQLGKSAIGLSHAQLDITQPESIARALTAFSPHVLINTAAYTLVDRAEQEEEACHLLNDEAVGYLAQGCATSGTTLVQISTDYVFGGSPALDANGQPIPRDESSPTCPQGIYAQSKLAGEQQAARCEKHLVVRTCGLYGVTPRRNNFVETMLRLGNQGKALRVVGDQHCTPSYVRDVARGVLFLVEQAAHGLYHITNHGATTWYDFAAQIFEQEGLAVALEKITTAQYAAPAARPQYSVLSCKKYNALGGPPLPSWQAALADYLAERAACELSAN